MRKRILASALMIAAATMLASGAVTAKSSKVKISGQDLAPRRGPVLGQLKIALDHR